MGIVVAGVYSQPGAGCGMPGALDEYVVLINTGDEPADLRGWSLTNRKRCDQQHHYRYIFPRSLSDGAPWLLEPGGMVLLYTGRGASGSTASHGEPAQYHLYQHRTERIWTDPGDVACLHDRSGNLVSSLELAGVRRTA